MKKFLSFILSITLILSCVSLPAVGAEETAEETFKTVLVNVAHGKDVYAAATDEGGRLTNGIYKEYLIPDQCNYGGGDVTLPTGDVVKGAASAADDWYIVDLGRKYRIQEIKFYSRGDGGWSDVWMTHFTIMVSNSITFDSDDTIDLGGIEASAADYGVTSPSAPFVKELDGSRAYRYVKLKKTQYSYHGYGEIEVYANQTVSEIPLTGNTVYTNSGSSLPGEKAINGTNENDADAWVNDSLNEYNYLSVDLGSKKHVGLIEMEGRNVPSENSATRQNINIYGSDNVDNLSSLTGSSLLSEDDGYTTLHQLGYANTYYTDMFPKYPDAFRRSINDDTAFRYITIRNTTKHASALGEVRLYEINPDILSVNWDAQKIYIHFSDEMSKDTASDSLVTITSADDGSVKNAPVSLEDSYTYSVDISALDASKAYTLEVLSDVCNIKGVGLAEDYIIGLASLYPVYAGNITVHAGTEAEGSPIDSIVGQDSVSAKASVSNYSSESAEVKIIVALYDALGNLESSQYTDYIVPMGKTIEAKGSLSFDASPTDGMYVKAFVWETGGNTIRPLTESKKVIYDNYNIYVSADAAEGGTGTRTSPFTSIEEAQKTVRQRNDDMTADINVHIMGGTYYLDDTLEYTEEDSGTNGYNVNYRAYNDAEVVVTGGLKLEDNWTLYDEDKNIYSIPVTGVDEIRDLYVDGRRARAARSTGRIRPIAMYYADDGETPLGYYVSAEDVGLYDNASDIRLFTTQVWKYTMWNVDSIIPSDTEGQNIIVMEPNSAFARAVNNDGSLCLSEDNAFYMENAFELLDEEGEFYFDGSTLYYKPASGENLSEVYVPRLDKLLTVTGSDMAHKVHNITFSGITFAHTRRSDLDKGYLGGQAQSVTPLISRKNAYPLDKTIVGADIRITRAEDIHFTDNTFTGLASVGLGVYEGSNDIVIRGNVFYETGDSAITVGLPSDAYMDTLYYDSDGDYIGGNVALYKNSFVSGDTASGAINGNDGVNTSVMVLNSTSDYYQIDLGRAYNISQIRIPSRKAYGSSPNQYETHTSWRKSFRVVASNDKDFADGGTVIAQQGSEAFDFEEGFVYDVESSAKYRYIRVQKTANEHIPMADIEVISPDITASNKEVSKRTIIDNNYITRVGEFNLGAPGIQLYYTEGAEISNNYIKDVPYSGICVGWGWLNTTDSTTAKNNKVLSNRVENYAMRTYDAGGIYLLGTQSGNLVDGNYFKNQPNAYFALYLDSGSENATLTNNVTENVAMVYGIGTMIEASPKKNLVINNNYSTSASFVNNPAEGTNSVVDDPIIYAPFNPPTGALAIIESAGLENEYANLVSAVPEGRWTLTTDDIYGDIIDHQVSREEGSVGESMPDTTMIHYYLSNLLKDARELCSLGESSASSEALAALNTAIAAAASKETEFKNIGYGYNGVTKGPIDRAELIEVRVALKNAIKAFCDSIAN